VRRRPLEVPPPVLEAQSAVKDLIRGVSAPAAFDAVRGLGIALSDDRITGVVSEQLSDEQGSGYTSHVMDRKRLRNPRLEPARRTARAADPAIATAIGEALRARLDEEVHVALPERMSKLLRALEGAEHVVPPGRGRGSW
jgi:hypothetical protein